MTKKAGKVVVDEPTAPPKPKMPSKEEVKMELAKIPKALSFFSLNLKQDCSRNDMLRIITWQAEMNKQIRVQLEARIKQLEDENEAKAVSAKLKENK